MEYKDDLEKVRTRKGAWATLELMQVYMTT